MGERCIFTESCTLVLYILGVFFFPQFTDNKYCLTLYNMIIYTLHNFMHIFIVFISFSLSFIDGLNGSSKWYYCSTALVQALMFVVVKLLPNR